jgi:hypothetical protein
MVCGVYSVSTLRCIPILCLPAYKIKGSIYFVGACKMRGILTIVHIVSKIPRSTMFPDLNLYQHLKIECQKNTWQGNVAIDRFRWLATQRQGKSMDRCIGVWCLSVSVLSFTRFNHGQTDVNIQYIPTSIHIYRAVEKRGYTSRLTLFSLIVCLQTIDYTINSSFPNVSRASVKV